MKNIREKVMFGQKKHKKVVIQTSNIDSNEVFDSELTIIESPKILVSYKTLVICNAISQKLKGQEFSLLLKGGWSKEGYVVSDDYVIPKQEVTGVSVDFTEDITPFRQQGYNIIIHRHPFVSNSFSQSDVETINTNFEASILYSEGQFTTATISIQVSDSAKLQIKADTSIYISDNANIDISNISEKKTKIGFYPYEDYDWNYKGKRRKKNKKNKDLDYYANYLQDKEDLSGI